MDIYIQYIVHYGYKACAFCFFVHSFWVMHEKNKGVEWFCQIDCQNSYNKLQII